MIGRQSSLPGRVNDSGEVNILMVPFIFLFLFFVAAAAFGVWAYSGRQDYRNNSSQKIAAAVQVAKQQQNAADTTANNEANKQPLKTYTGPEQYGSVQVSYPKTWSGYVDDTAGSSQPLDGYFQPGVVPSITNTTSTFALRVEIISQLYASVVSGFSSSVTSKTVTAAAYSFPKVSSVVGIRYDGAILSGQQITGSMVVMPIRDKTLEIWTESPVYQADFNNYILPNVVFSP